MIDQKITSGSKHTLTILGQDGNIPWWVRGNPKLAAERELTSGEIGTIRDAILVDPVGVYCALIPELRRRGMKIEATFSYVNYPDADSKTGYSFAINNLSDDEQENAVKKFSEQERYYARKNRKMDYGEALDSACAHASKAAYALTEKAGASLGADPDEGVIDGTEEMAWSHYLDKATVSMEIPFGDLKEIIKQAYQSGVDKGREQGGLKALFEGEA
ncbi:hypothetical protein VH79_25125 [Salmonella enterica]|uniref:Uncharacterized protein n=1 Tax=Salmonella enterica TaxID=28901 RepID=A0A5U3IUV3_SALER|nr:hypothetical protein [Salmonella enterica]